MDTIRRKRPAALIGLLLCLAFLALGGLAGAYGLLADPSGAGMGVSLDLLAQTPVRDFTLPGLFLLVVYGLAPLATIYGLWALPEWGRKWAWRAAVGLGVVLILWVALEFWLWGWAYFSVWEPIMGVLGVLILALAVAPAVRAYARAK